MPPTAPTPYAESNNAAAMAQAADAANPQNGSASQNVSGSAEQAPVFHSKEIGTKTVKKEDPFRKQNENAKASQQKQAQYRKIAIIIAIVLAALLAIGLIIWLLIPKSTTKQPVDDGGEDNLSQLEPSIRASNEWYERAIAVDEGDEEVNLSMLDDDASAIDSGEDVLDAALEQAETIDEKISVQLAQMYFFYDAEQYDKVIEISRQLDPEKMTLEEQAIFYNTVALAAGELEDYELSDEAYYKTIEIAQQLGGRGSGDDKTEGSK